MQYRDTIRRSRLSARVAAAATAAAAIVLLMGAPNLTAQISTYGPKGLPAMNTSMGRVDSKPSVLKKVGILQHLDYQLPLNLKFTDDHGNLVPLSTYFGKDFNIIVVSIDPADTTKMAAAKKAEYVKMYGHANTADGWHFMTGTQANIDALTKVVGFKYVKLKVPGTKLHQYAHASSLEIVTPEGKLAQYYMGVEYSPKDMLLGLDEASDNRIGSPVDNILTYCYHYDPLTNTHDLIVSRVVEMGAIFTILILGSFMLVMFRKDFRKGGKSKPANLGTANKVNG